MFLKRLFAPSGTLKPYKLFTPEHWGIAGFSFFIVAIALILSRKMTKQNVYKTVKICTITLWIFETIKIVFNLLTGNADNPNTYIPLYFCSIVLYAGIFSIFSKGKLKHASDVFIVVGGIVGGVAYMLCPNTTAGTYPIFHYITMQSFLHHSIMVYLGALFLITDYVELKISDLTYYSSIVAFMCLITYVVNNTFDLNLMFLNETYPNTPIDVIYKLSPKYFSLNMTLMQSIPPFVVIYGLVKIFNRKKAK